MQVKLLTSLSGAKCHDAGSKYECSAEEAQRLVERGYAEYIREEKVEKAVKRRKKVEKAAK